MVMGDLYFSSAQFGQLVDELLRRQRCAVLGRIDVAQTHVLR